MKQLIIITCAIILCGSLRAQPNNPEYDSTLAKTFGADDYGMKPYVLVILKTGSNNMEKGKVRDSLFRGHRSNIGRLAQSGKLVIAGPMEDNPKSYQGIFILNAKTIGEAEELLQTDPVIHSKILDAELYEWYGSAALGEYLKVQNKITRKHF